MPQRANSGDELSSCQKFAWIATASILLVFAVIFVAAGSKLMLMDIIPSENCTIDVIETGDLDILDYCNSEAYARRFMSTTGYAMGSIGLIFGMGFVAITVWFCLRKSRRHQRQRQAERSHINIPANERNLPPYRSSAESGDLSEIYDVPYTDIESGMPPDYETACRMPPPVLDDQSVDYQPPSTNPPSVEETRRFRNVFSWFKPRK